MELQNLDDRVRQLTCAWRLCRDVPVFLEVRRDYSVTTSVLNQKVTSCAQWEVTFRELTHADILAEFLQIFELAFAAGPRVLNDVVYGQSCPLSWCTCCDEMEYHLVLNIKAWTCHENVDIAAVLDCILFHWDTTNESHECRELRAALLSYPQLAQVCPIQVTLGWCQQSDPMDISSEHIQSLQHLLEHAAISKCNGGREVKLYWYYDEYLCSKRSTQQLVSPPLSIEKEDVTCPFHCSNRLSIVLVDGDVSRYVSTPVNNFRMTCGGCPEVVLIGRPPRDAEEQAQQMLLICNLDTDMPFRDILLCSGRVLMIKNHLVMYAWNTNPLVEGIHVMKVMWLPGLISNDHLKQLLELVGWSLRQLTLTSTITVSQLVLIFNQCTQLTEITFHELAIEDSFYHQQRTNSRLQSLNFFVKPALDDITPNLMATCVLRLIGQSLRTLQINSLQICMDAATCQTVARFCRNLQALFVSGVDDTFCDEVVKCFDQGYLCKVKTLWISFNRFWNAPDHILMALTDPRRAITRCLRTFSVMGGYPTSRTLTLMGKMLAQNDTLVNVHLYDTKYEEHGGEIVRGAMGRMPLRHICALLSGLQFVLNIDKWVCFPIELIQQILIYTGRIRPAYRTGVKPKQRCLLHGTICAWQL